MWTLEQIPRHRYSGWTNNKLRVKPSSSVSRVEVLSPLSNAFGTVSRTVGGGGVSSPPTLQLTAQHHPAMRMFTAAHVE